MDEYLIIEEAINGNEDSFKVLYDKYHLKIFNYVFGKVSNKSDVDDVVQEAFSKTFKNFRYYKKECGSFYNFLLSNCNQILCDYYKKKSYRDNRAEQVELDENIVGVDTVNLFEIANGQYNLFDAIDKLPDDQRIAFNLIYVKKLKYKEAAKIMGKTESSIKSLAFRARKTLRAEIVKENPGIGKRYGIKEVFKIVAIAAVCFALIGGFGYAMVRLYKESNKKNTYILSEVMSDVPEENSTISREDATKKINEYLDILGMDVRAEEEELHLINDFNLDRNCWSFRNNEVLLSISAIDAKILEYSCFDSQIESNDKEYNEIIEEIGVLQEYELYSCEKKDDSIYLCYAKKYDEIFNLYQRITIVIENNNIKAITRLDYEYEDTEILVSKEEAINILEEKGIEVESVELVIENLDFGEGNVATQESGKIEKLDITFTDLFYSDLLYVSNNTTKVWKAKTIDNEIYFVNSNTGKVIESDISYGSEESN